MMQYKGFSAWIEVDKVKLPIYGEEVLEGSQRCTGWIASEAGKAFAVCWKDSNRDMTTTGKVRIDGTVCGVKSIRAAPVSSPLLLQPSVARKSYLRISETETKPFKFSPLRITDDDRYLGASSTVSEIGTIEIKIWRSAVGKGKAPRPTAAPQETVVHERSKKAMPHCVTFGETTTTKVPRYLSTAHLDKQPLVTFVFNYRPIDLLRANGVVPLLVKQKRGAAEAQLDDIAAGQDKIRDLEKQLKSLKGRQDAGAPKKPKKEPSGPSSIVSGEIIDLTDGGRTSLSGTSKRMKREKNSGVPAGFVSGEIIDLT
ncbi:hypothetical protein PLICRDRAFT_364325 [Plicaturopsis crispa FD-325 SS-3]|uniref:DUF7918 domain-containing protein n=1 Tax=Plicaturopsis crispa FD-325 SS-3 TaxID=944288 RepID=A0A0C9SKV8_PLICR|nr:hypothetical protein PLICRDRAFT_364325 [Plicaturopsis crispa FD-325 SS-3]